MDINKTAPAVATHELVIHAPLGKVWDLITKVDRWPDWNPAVKTAKLGGPLKVGATFNWKSGQVPIESTVQEYEPMTRLVWTGKAIGTRAIHVWSFEVTSAGTVVSTSESFEGWLVNLMRKSMQTSLDRSLVAWLKELKHQAEQGAGPNAHARQSASRASRLPRDVANCQK